MEEVEQGENVEEGEVGEEKGNPDLITFRLAIHVLKGSKDGTVYDPTNVHPATGDGLSRGKTSH